MQHKYFFLTVLTFLFSCQTDSAMQCYECLGTCRNMKKITCREGTKQCMTASINQDNYEFLIKTCLTQSSCDEKYYYKPNVSAKPTCCDTDLCNSAFNNMMSLGTAVLLPLVFLYLSQF